MPQAPVATPAAPEPELDTGRVLDGPAGHRLYGGEVRDAALDFGSFDRDELKDNIRDALHHEDPQLSDPAERARVAAAERVARDEARRPYLPPDPRPVAFTRLPTRGGTQVEEVIAFLRSSGLAARPDHVFGVYRVPDWIGGGSLTGSEKGLVEWDVVYRPLVDAASMAPGAAADAPVDVASFVATDRWVERRVGEPSVLDEDLPLEFLARAGIGPERCLGIARVSEFRTLRFGGDDDDYMRTIVKGVVALHQPLGVGDGALARMAESVPVTLRDPAESGVRVEVLNWHAVAQVVHPKMHEPPLVPSPFAYLPSTSEELLQAYLEVVGIDPADCYGAQATVDRMRSLVPGGFLTSDLGSHQPCADGSSRKRLHACEHVVVVYRDSPVYVEGRARWDAYQRDVLIAHLERGVSVRPPVEDDRDLSYIPRGFRTAVKVGETLSNLELAGQEKPPPFRYCWPPVE